MPGWYYDASINRRKSGHIAFQRISKIVVF